MHSIFGMTTLSINTFKQGYLTGGPWTASGPWVTYVRPGKNIYLFTYFL